MTLGRRRWIPWVVGLELLTVVAGFLVLVL